MASNLSHRFYANMTKSSADVDFAFQVIPEDFIFKVIKGIKLKSIGLDWLCVTKVKLCLPFLLPIITHIINVT